MGTVTGSRTGQAGRNGSAGMPGFSGSTGAAGSVIGMSCDFRTGAEVPIG